MFRIEISVDWRKKPEKEVIEKKPNESGVKE
jgi:hypothetical protein